MFSKDSYEEGEGEVEDISKFESIIHRILPLIQEYKDYKLYGRSNIMNVDDDNAVSIHLLLY